MKLFYMSFVDPERPEGRRLLGACVVEAESAEGAMAEAWLRGCNPGGEIALVGPLPEECYGPGERNRLMAAEEAYNSGRRPAGDLVIEQAFICEEHNRR